METVARELLITGHVQAVNYRNNCRRQARSLGLTGWVRNLPDGSVQAHVQGPAQAVQDLVDWCHEGPRAAQVDRVRVQQVDAEELSSFDIR